MQFYTNLQCYFFVAGFGGHRTVISARQRRPRGADELRQGSRRLQYKLPNAQLGIRREPLRPGRRGHVRLHVDVRRGKRLQSDGEERVQTAHDIGRR